MFTGSLDDPAEEDSVASFAEAFEKLKKIAEEKPEPKKQEAPFATLLRNSKLVKLGDPEKKIVVGKVTTVLENDVYIDFGAKFPAICRRPPSTAM